EIDALAADGEGAEDDAEDGGRPGAEQDREFGRQAPDLGSMGGDIACRAEIGGMAEGEQPAVTEQEIEGGGEQREAQHLHQEDGIEEERRGQRKRERHGEDRQMQPRRSGGGDGDADAGGGGFGSRDHQAALPKRPAGFTSSTMAMMTKITTAEPSG